MFTEKTKKGMQRSSLQGNEQRSSHLKKTEKGGRLCWEAEQRLRREFAAMKPGEEREGATDSCEMCDGAEARCSMGGGRNGHWKGENKQVWRNAGTGTRRWREKRWERSERVVTGCCWQAWERTGTLITHPGVCRCVTSEITTAARVFIDNLWHSKSWILVLCHVWCKYEILGLMLSRNVDFFFPCQCNPNCRQSKMYFLVKSTHFLWNNHLYYYMISYFLNWF